MKAQRRHRLIAPQQKISLKRLAGKVGRRLPVIIDTPGAAISKGRSQFDAPEIDGAVHVTSRRSLRAGDIVSVKIERADAYDLHGVAI